MTKTQIKKLLAAAALEAVSYEVTGKGADWEVECADRRTSVLVRRVLRRAGVYAGGFKAGWGGWVYKAKGQPSGYQYTCDYGDKASIHHY